MEAIVERVSGVDVGQATVVATMLIGAAHERPKKETRTFRTVTNELATAGLVAGQGSDPGRAGGHRGLLETRPRGTGGRVRSDRGQCSPHQERSGTKDGCQRQ